MFERVEIDTQKVFKDLEKLCKTPGPTQACVKVSENDPRIDGEFPMETAIREIVKELNDELKENGKKRLLIIRHMGNLIIIGGLEELENVDYDEAEIIDADKLSIDFKNKVKNIPVIFGAHLDEIAYLFTNKPSYLIEKEEYYEIIPICNPPKLTKADTIGDEEEFKKYLKENLKQVKDEEKKEYVKILIDKVLNPKCKIFGFRKRKFTKIGEGEIYKVKKLKFKTSILGKSKLEMEDYNNKFLLKITSKYENMDIKVGDIVIQDYLELVEKGILKSKALDDRVGCVACIYAVKELSEKRIPAKTILTSSEEGVPEDVSWGRFVRATYKEFCNDETVTIICDGMDGKKLKEFEGKEECLSEAVIVPYTSNGKGGGDFGVFSLLRDEILPKLRKLYNSEISVITTDYSSRSYEVKIMDRWTLIGFVQWTCGTPLDNRAICHNEEKVSISQVGNIIRTFVHIGEYFENLKRSK